MRFLNTAVFTILATSAFVSAAPAVITTENTVVKRDSISDALTILDELTALKQKRSLLEDEDELIALNARDDNLVTELVEAIASSGIASDVWTALTNDSSLRTEIVSILKSTVKSAISEGSVLIKAVWNSGLITELFDDLENDTELRSVLLKIGKSVFEDALTYIEGKFGSSATTTTTSTSTSTSAAKREENYDYELSKRDTADIISSIVSAIKSSGIISTLVNKVMSDPSSAISFLTSALKTGAVYAKDIYEWSKDNGLLADGLEWIEKHGGSYTSAVASWLLGKVDSGSDSSTTATATTATATTATATSTTTATLDAAASSAEAALNALTRKVRRMY